MLTRLIPLLLSSPASSTVAGLGLSTVDVAFEVTHHVRLPGDGGRAHHTVVVGHVAARLQGESNLGQTSEHSRAWRSEVEPLTCSPPRLGFRLRQGRWQMHIFCPAEGEGRPTLMMSHGLDKQLLASELATCLN